MWVPVRIPVLNIYLSSWFSISLDFDRFLVNWIHFHLFIRIWLPLHLILIGLEIHRLFSDKSWFEVFMGLLFELYDWRVDYRHICCLINIRGEFQVDLIFLHFINRVFKDYINIFHFIQHLLLFFHYWILQMNYLLINRIYSLLHWRMYI